MSEQSKLCRFKTFTYVIESKTFEGDAYDRLMTGVTRIEKDFGLGS